MTTERYRKPVQVGTYVISATQSWSGPSAVKSRSTRSGAGRVSFSPAYALNSGLTREASDSLCPNSHSLFLELSMNAGSAVGAVALLVDRLDPLSEQSEIGRASCRERV